MRAQRIAGQTSTNAVYYAQVVESINNYGLAGQTVTLSFYVTAGSNYSGGSSFGFQLLNGTGTDEGMSSMNSGTWTGAAYPGTTLTPTTNRTKITYTTTLGASVREIAVRFYWAGAGTAGANDFVDITGVQLELGSQATAFDWRPYGTELQLCQRYFWRTAPLGAAVGGWVSPTWSGYATNGYFQGNTLQFPVQMRAAPTGTKFGTFNAVNIGQPYAIETDTISSYVSAGATATGQAYFLPNGSGYLTFSAEL
jgi:hypothetical protein